MPGPGWGGAVPFVAGLAGGALASWSLGYEPSPLPPRKYGFFDPITNPAQRNMAGDIGRLADRQATAFMDVATNPISPGAYLNLAKATFDNIRELPGAIMAWAESLKDSQERLRMFSGQLANVFMESEWREMMREFRSAGRTAGTTTGLVKALDDLKDDLLPFRDLLTNIANSVATIAVRGLDMAVNLAKAVTYLDEITTIANWWFSKTTTDDLPPVLEMWRSIKPRDTETRPPRRPPA